jgi:hypothetical protein
MATASAKSVNQKMNPDGTVTIYDIAQQKWKQSWLVDARELVANGSCSLGGPEVRMTGPSGEVVVCQEQVKDYETRGYAVVEGQELADPANAEPPANPNPNPPPQQPQNPDEPPAPYNFSRHVVAELRQFATQAGIQDAASMNKQQLVEALDRSGWRPA